MYRVRVAGVALLALLIVSAVSQAQEKKKGNSVSGTVKSVDADAKSITLTVKAKKESADKTFSVADDAKVTINGEKKSLADVEVGAKAALRLSEDGKTVVAINVGKKKKKDA